MSREGVTRTRIDYRNSQQANRYRRQGSIWKIVLILWCALPEGGVGGGRDWRAELANVHNYLGLTLNQFF